MNSAANISTSGLIIESVTREVRVSLQAFVRIDGRRYEFTRSSLCSRLEVYDFPRSWSGTPRFLGYVPAEQVAKVDTLVRAYEHRQRAALTD